MLTLVGAVVIVAVGCWLRERRAFHRLTGAGVGVVGAYAVSELVKLLVQEERPCRALDVSTVLACPGTGDWSWPSNHATVAAALAVACFFAVPRLVWLVAPLAALVAAARVAAGVHYAHDVLAGLALGVVGVTVAVVALHRARGHAGQP
ncbi:phosphatase PAP2 family protein [Nocardioides sp. SYSU DS0651]|uniref:phosphatase PAP2 family protein n=1 Tax=Nocardioides sp. SYSU DS0651 TaxID=3415955 RepID=UPI003F4CA341